ncbi:MAG: hypothetical protein IKU93_02850 [Alistipes sp.]|nr:hypothetical protein [Alistipes sp.]
MGTRTNNSSNSIHDERWIEKYGADYVSNLETTDAIEQEADEEAKAFDHSAEINTISQDGRSVVLPGGHPQVQTGTPPPQSTTSTDPYEATKKAQEEAYKSWRTMLADNYKKRQEENKKKVRNAQIVGLGKALGDLVAGIWGGVVSSKNNVPAIVPAMQSSKTSEQIEKLINEGVVNSKDYDTMLQNLALQQEKDKIALAKSYDELGIKHKSLAEQREYETKKLQEQRKYEEQKAEKAFERQKELRRIDNTNKMALQIQRGKDMVAAAQIRNNGGERPKFSDGDMAILGAALPEEITVTTEKPNKYGEVETSTQTKPYKPNANDMRLELARQKEEMKRYGLSPDKKEDLFKWASIISDKKSLITALPNVSAAQIMAALVAGYTGEEVLAHFKNR